MPTTAKGTVAPAVPSLVSATTTYSTTLPFRRTFGLYMVALTRPSEFDQHDLRLGSQPTLQRSQLGGFESRYNHHGGCLTHDAYRFCPHGQFACVRFDRRFVSLREMCSDISVIPNAATNALR